VVYKVLMTIDTILYAVHKIQMGCAVSGSEDVDDNRAVMCVVYKGLMTIGRCCK